MQKLYNLYNLEPPFKNFLLAEKVSSVTLKNYLSDIRHFLGWLVVYKKNSVIPESDDLFDEQAVKGYLNYLKVNKVPEATLNRRLSTLRKFSLFCTNSQLIKSNFMLKSPIQPPIPQLVTIEPQVNLIKVVQGYFGKLVEPSKNLFHSHSFIRYSILGVLILILSGYISINMLAQQKVRSQGTAINSAGRVLTFQGNLTDKLGNPITSKTDLIFKLYTKESGGSAIYTGKCIGESALTPDVHGVFTTTIGGDCGMKKIPVYVFIDNPNLFLGITVGSDPEMQPRQKIANVGNASNAQNLDGFGVGGDVNSIPHINNSGIIEIDAASPTIESNSGTFTLKGKSLTLASSAPDGDIRLSPRGGNVFIDGNLGIGSSIAPTFKLEVTGDIGPSMGYVYNIGSPLKQFSSIYGETLYQNNYQVCDTSGNCGGVNSWSNTDNNVYLTNLTNKVGIGTASPIHKLSIEGSIAGKALVSLWEQGTQDILVASRSASIPVTVFKLTNRGSIKTGANSSWMPLSDGTNGLNIATAGETPFVTFDTVNLRVGIGITTPDAKLHVSGANTGKALTILDETGNQNILVASASGTTKFVLNRDGYMAIGKDSIGTNKVIDTSANDAYLGTDGNWQNPSSRDFKSNFTGVNYEEILAKIEELDISKWNYNVDSESVKHIGPIAEDFYDKFGLGYDNKHINSVDGIGVVFAGLKGLTSKTDRIIHDIQSKLDNNVSKLNELSRLINNPNSSIISLNDTGGEYSYIGLLNQSKDSIITKIMDTGEFYVKMAKTSVLTAEEAFVNNLLAAKNITTDSLLALNGHIDTITTNILNVSEKISSPIIETNTIIASEEAKIGTLKTNQIDTNSDNLTITLNGTTIVNDNNKATNVENKGNLAKLIIKGLEGKVVSSIDELGNATFSGKLEAETIRTNDLNSFSINSQTATISGSLIARTIKSDNIDSLTSDVNFNSQTLDSHAAYLEKLNNSVNEVQNLLGEIRNEPINTSNYNNLMQALTLSLSNVIQPTNSVNNTNVMTDLDNLENLTVLGSANIYKVGITDSLTVGNVFVRDNSILSLAWDLNISSLSNINFFDGVISLHKDGSLISKGQIIAQSGIRTNKISTINDDEDFAIQLNNHPATITQPKFSIQDGRSTEVASINTLGEARFKSIALDKYAPKNTPIISATENFNTNGQYAPAMETESYAAGEGLLPAQNAEVIIYNQSLKEDSLVYLTSTSTNSSISLSISEKRTCTDTQLSCRPYFKVRSNSVLPTPITFNWLLVN